MISEILRPEKKDIFDLKKCFFAIRLKFIMEKISLICECFVQIIV